MPTRPVQNSETIEFQGTLVAAKRPQLQTLTLLPLTGSWGIALLQVAHDVTALLACRLIQRRVAPPARH